MIRNRLKAFVVTAIAVLAAMGSAEPLTLTGGEQFYWNGHESTIIEPFRTEGRWKLTLGASCFEGVGFVSVDIYDASDVLVDQVRVLGEGISSIVVEPPAGEYYLDIHVSNHHVYTWEIVVEPTDEDLTNAQSDAHLHQVEAEVSGGSDESAALSLSGDAQLTTVAHLSVVTLPHAWSGSRVVTTEAFEVSGQWKVSLGAWCHEGVSHVRATAYDHEGVEVGQVTVFGEGEQTATFDTGPGIYYLVVTSPNMDAYSWELLVESLATEAAATEEPEATQEEAAETQTQASTVDAPLSGVVEILMTQDATSAYFDPVGVWVEPGTTIRFVLGEGVHDSRAYHPDNAIQFSRIPEGAESWDSGILGGLLDRTGIFEVTLTVEGVYDYFCAPHHAMGMVGRIIVGDPEASPARPVDELPFDAAKAVLPSVEEILESIVVSWTAP